MARQLEVLPKDGRSSGYPWDEWTDGSVWLAEPGTDYTCSTANFRSLLWKTAQRKGLTVTVRAHADGVAFQFAEVAA